MRRIEFRLRDLRQDKVAEVEICMRSLENIIQSVTSRTVIHAKSVATGTWRVTTSHSSVFLERGVRGFIQMLMN